MCKYYSVCPAADKRSEHCTIHLTTCNDDCVQMLIEAYHLEKGDLGYETLAKIFHGYRSNY